MARASVLGVLALLACQAPPQEPASADVGGSGVVPARASVAETNDRARSAAVGTSSTTQGAVVPASEHTLRFDATAFGRVDVVVRVPEHTANSELPLLVAFHGRGETLKGPKLGARGWLDDYRLERTVTRLKAPPLESKDFLGAVSKSRLESINSELAAQPFRDFVVVMPYLPDALKGEYAFRNAEPLAALLLDEVLPRIARDVPVRTASTKVGIDGVSLGGRAALLIGFARPKSFAVIGGTQPAIDDGELERLVDMAKRARAERSGLALRLLTSQDDYYRDVVTEYSTLLRAAGVPHTFDVVEGDHSYDFNRGPGGIEMMRFYSRELWR